MIVLLNPNACGGTALDRWEMLKPHLAMDNARIHLLDGELSARAILADALRHSEHDFIAAGGDGTVNILVNQLLNIADAPERGRIRVGAIGLGSSNDFHKPFDRTTILSGMPVSINFSDASPRDIGCITCKNGDEFSTRYFLINASIGVVAEANRFFDQPDLILQWLKRTSTSAAISYAAIKTMFGYDNLPLEITCDDRPARMVRLTHLGILKNLNFSGALHWSGVSDYHDGYFQVRLCDNMSFTDRFRLMQACANGTAESLQGVESCRRKKIVAASREPFTVECDGETFRTTHARFEIMPRHLTVCGSQPSTAVEGKEK